MYHILQGRYHVHMHLRDGGDEQMFDPEYLERLSYHAEISVVALYSCVLYCTRPKKGYPTTTCSHEGLLSLVQNAVMGRVKRSSSVLRTMSTMSAF